MDFASRIKEQRTRLGYSQKEVAEALFVTRQTVSKWETGKSYPDLELLASLSDLYEISVDSLLKADGKLMEFLNDNPRATKKQKLISAIITGIGMLVFIGMAVSVFFSSKVPATFRFIESVLIVVPIVFLVIIGIYIAKILRKKESPLAQKKRLSAPTHKLENKRILAEITEKIVFIGGTIALSMGKLVIAFIFLVVQLVTVIFSFHYTKQIQGKPNTHHVWKKFRDYSNPAKFCFTIFMLFCSGSIIYIFHWALNR